jgi:DNA-binding transcriptional LysR family regulator
LHVTQSTVSTRVQTLEAQLGRPVFERSKTGATLTTAGRHFQRHASALVRTWTQARLDAGLPDEIETALEIGAVPSLWDGFLIDALPELMAKLPNVAIRASLATSDVLAQQLDEGSLDLAVIYQPRNTTGLTVFQLFEDEFVLVSSNPDPLADPLDDNYVLIDWGPEFRADHLLNFPQLATPALQLGIGTLGLQYLKGAPAAGYFPSRLITQEAKAARLRLIEDAPRFAYAAYAVTNDTDPDGYVGQAASILRTFAKTSFVSG